MLARLARDEKASGRGTIAGSFESRLAESRLHAESIRRLLLQDASMA